MAEEWKRLEDTHFLVSNQGRVWSEKQGNFPSILVDHNGYCRIYINRKRRMVHRLVAKCFIEDSKLQIDHIDGDKLNNNVTNLRYCTARENTTYDREKRRSFSKLIGVSKGPSRGGRWRAEIRLEGKARYIGLFDVEQEARDAYLDVLENGVEAIEKYRRVNKDAANSS